MLRNSAAKNHGHSTSESIHLKIPRVAVENAPQFNSTFISVHSGISTTEEYDVRVPDEIPEDEVQLHEELQIILPPRCDDVSADSSITTTSTDTFS